MKSSSWLTLLVALASWTACDEGDEPGAAPADSGDASDARDGHADGAVSARLDGEAASDASGTVLPPVYARCVPSGPCQDLALDVGMLASSVVIETRDIAPTSCSVAEGTILASGRRRLLRFTTYVTNVGTADLFSGDPRSNMTAFVYASCHGHYHFKDYADYALKKVDGTVAVMGTEAIFLRRGQRSRRGSRAPSSSAAAGRECPTRPARARPLDDGHRDGLSSSGASRWLVGRVLQHDGGQLARHHGPNARRLRARGHGGSAPHDQRAQLREQRGQRSQSTSPIRPRMARRVLRPPTRCFVA